METASERKRIGRERRREARFWAQTLGQKVIWIGGKLFAKPRMERMPPSVGDCNDPTMRSGLKKIFQSMYGKEMTWIGSTPYFKPDNSTTLVAQAKELPKQGKPAKGIEGAFPPKLFPGVGKAERQKRRYQQKYQR